MNRRTFIARTALCSLSQGPAAAHWLRAAALPNPDQQPSPAQISEPHFPDRVHLFVWRNWELANADRLALVLGTTPEKVLGIGISLGLPAKPNLTADQLRRIYITVIRQNWHILPDDQLIQLLGWDRQKYEYTLREDDFLFAKLGYLKPACDTLRYEPPSAEVQLRVAEIRRIIGNMEGLSLEESGEPAFQFVSELSSENVSSLRDPDSHPTAGEIDVGRGWAVVPAANGDKGILSLVQSFKAFMQAAFDSELTTAADGDRAGKKIYFATDPSTGNTIGSFHIQVRPDTIRIVGRDLSGLRQALYFLQDQMEARGGPFLEQGVTQRATRFDPRFAYSYFALYGDPLMDESIDPFPNGFLKKLARSGVNGVWLQGVLRNLAPSSIFPEFGAGAETRLRNLRSLVERAQAQGVKIFLYLNEPRAMPAEFFARYPQIKGTPDAHDSQYFAMCTSTPEVRDWMRQTLAYVFKAVPELGGVFSITASENLTNCYSHGRAQFCPRCSQRTGEEVIAEVIRTFRDGVRASSAKAEVIAWDWGWGEDWVKSGGASEGIIERLPADVRLQSVSEWSKPINRGGVATKVGEYSISVVGPGPRALHNWELARRAGLSTTAKVQFNNSWELSAVPYIPVPNLIVEHCQNLANAQVQGLQLSWTLGGYPSPNFDAAKQYYFSPSQDAATSLRQAAVKHYGSKAAPLILQAWDTFSRAFEEFPMEGGGVVYHLPTQHGPANLLRLHPTGYKATMSLFPYDDYRSWTGSYPAEIAQALLEKLATIWASGLENFRQAIEVVPSYKRESARKDLGIATTCYLHFRSAANQIRFYRLRDQFDGASGDSRKRLATEMAKVAEEEIALSKRQYTIARQDSRIAYEATCHYFYRPVDLLEKILNCRDVIEKLQAASS